MPSAGGWRSHPMSLALEAVPPTGQVRRDLAVYFAALTLALGFSVPGGVASLPIQFLLKDDLHLGPQGMAAFEALILVPACLGFLSGWLRDRWRPSRLADRGCLMIGGAVAIGCYLCLALPVS